MLTLIQNGRAAPRPVILLCEKDNPYWDAWVDYVREHLLDDGYISDHDMHLFEQHHTAQSAANAIHHFYSTYHSIRYFGNLAVLRLNQAISPKFLQQLNHEFDHIVVEGEMEYYEPESFNIDDHLPHLHRLVFSFNMKQFGELTRLIKMINDNAKLN